MTTAPQSLSMLEIRRFTQAECPESFQLAIGLRREVFVTEQQGPLEDEPDGYDQDATHWLLLEKGTSTVVATGRLVAYQEACQMPPVAKIGRIAVSREYRGRRLGERVMSEAIAFARQKGYAQSILDAQTYALAFYEKLGFVAEGDEFEEGGLPHKRMRLILR